MAPALRSEEVDVRPRPSDDAGMPANRPGPAGLPSSDRHAAACSLSCQPDRPTLCPVTWRSIDDNAVYLKAISRLTLP